MTADHVHQEKANLTIAPIYSFPKGLPGFDQLKEFLLQEHNEVFSLLSAVDQPEISFITVNPFDFIPDYEFSLPDDTMLDIEVNNREQVAVRCIVTWHSEREKITINLLAPLIFNVESFKAKQIVLQNTIYTTKHPLWSSSEAVEEGGDS
ncbi:flagellar assembly protein FliW [Paenibacillus graminis]|uniref:Flagellar assembly factor FliW n=1 Tax=Paenibacillus graminis TaxID=189425 RepID=A0A089MDG8_9BACL|nr:flagellar assembly protein FliW [Paenibacillus graminis]AIQ71342.1 flagellar assembly protein FliW [Paenibacillus graminis]